MLLDYLIGYFAVLCNAIGQESPRFGVLPGLFTGTD